MSGARRQTLGFGFDPGESPYHFVVTVPRAAEAPVTIEERFTWGEAGLDEESEPRLPMQKARLGRVVWDRIAPNARVTFNEALRRAGRRPGEWRAGENYLAPFLGKELTLLAWAVELETDEATISKMLANWRGLQPEERWWLYATVNASFRDPGHGPERGWRKAIKIAFAENPVVEVQPPPPEQKTKERAARRTPERPAQLRFDALAEPPAPLYTADPNAAPALERPASAASDRSRSHP